LEAGQFLAGSTNAVQGRLNILLGQLKSQSKIELTAALDLIRNYLAREALQSIAPSLGAAIAIDDANRYVIADDVLIKTKEGATLSAVVVRKKGVTEPQPASLFFNIYTDLRVHMREAKIATLHGYVGVAADARGKRLSPDTVAPYDSEVQDTYGVIDWISKQTWSNGKVGMYGSSYIGFAQWACENQRIENLRVNALTNPHSPGKYRINGIVSDLPQFQKAFDCKDNAPMVRGAKECQVW